MRRVILFALSVVAVLSLGSDLSAGPVRDWWAGRRAVPAPRPVPVYAPAVQPTYTIHPAAVSETRYAPAVLPTVTIHPLTAPACAGGSCRR